VIILVVIDNSKLHKRKNNKTPNKRSQSKKNQNNTIRTSKWKYTPKVKINKKALNHDKEVSENIKLKDIAIKVFVIEVIILFVFSAVPISKSYQSKLVSSFNSLAGPIYNQSYPMMVYSIASHNLEVATSELIPVIGPAEFVLSSSITAITAETLGKSENASVPGPLLMFGLFLLPDTWIELIAYSAAVAESIMLLLAILKKTFKHEVKRAVYVWVFIVIDLFVAASLESGALVLKNVVYLMMLWIPAFIIVGLFLVIAKKLRIFTYSKISNRRLQKS